MSRQSITEKIWYDPSGTNSIMLDVTSEIPAQKPMAIDGTLLLPKDEYHCTLVPAGKLSNDMRKVAEIIGNITDYFQFNPNAVQFTGLTDQYYLCKDEEEVTLIVEATLTGLNGLRKLVQQSVPSYKTTLAHVTLLKNGASQYGIGVNSTGDLKRLCKKVNLDAS